MSALGQKLPRRLTATVSALPPKAATAVADGASALGQSPKCVRSCFWV